MSTPKAHSSRAAVGRYSSKKRKSWKRRQLAANKRKRCEVCQLPFNKTDRIPTVDHIVPRCLGGEDIESNWKLMCLACNQRKADAPAGDTQ